MINFNNRIRIDPPDNTTKYPHMHIYNDSVPPQLLDINGNIVDETSPDAHIPYFHYLE